MWPGGAPAPYYPPPPVYAQPAQPPAPQAGYGYGHMPGQAPAYPVNPTWGPPQPQQPGAPPLPGVPTSAPPVTYAAVPAAPPPPPAAYGPQKKAVLIGCTYPGTSAALNGCINDVKCMKHMLQTRFGFQESNIIVLKDDVHHPDWFPTRANIVRAIQWLMSGLVPGTSLFFHFSGHGSQKADFTGDEEDGLDETILPTDYKQAGQIVDDELNAMLVRPLPHGVVLHAVVDACHSGTVLDLSFRTKYKSGLRWKGRPNPSKGTWGGTALQFGACRDSQVAQDTNRLSGNVHTGAATFSFIQAVERGGAAQSYAQLLAAMSHALEGPGPAPTPGVANMVMGLLLGGSMSSGQTPVLSCDKPMDLNVQLMI